MVKFTDARQVRDIQTSRKRYVEQCRNLVKQNMQNISSKT